MFKQLLENLTQFASDKRFEAKAQEAYKFYEKRTGAIYHDDLAYEQRMTSFLEWFVFSVPAGDDGQRVLDVYRNEMARGSEEELAMVDSLSDNLHDLFVIKSSKNSIIKATALFTNKNFKIEDDRADTIHKGDIFEARIANYEKRWFMTNGLCNHPPKALKYIKGEMKRIRQENGEGLLDFVFQLVSKSTKWERSRNIDVTEIYK